MLGGRAPVCSMQRPQPAVKSLRLKFSVIAAAVRPSTAPIISFTLKPTCKDTILMRWCDSKPRENVTAQLFFADDGHAHACRTRCDADAVKP